MRVEDFKTFKKSLGPVADKYTETELRQLQQDLRAMAELLFDMYLSKNTTDAERHNP